MEQFSDSSPNSQDATPANETVHSQSQDIQNSNSSDNINNTNDLVNNNDSISNIIAETENSANGQTIPGRVYAAALLSGLAACTLAIIAASFFYNKNISSSSPSVSLLLDMLPLHGAAIISIIIFLKLALPSMTWQQRLQWDVIPSQPSRSHALTDIFTQFLKMFFCCTIVNILTTCIFFSFGRQTEPQPIVQMMNEHINLPFFGTVLFATAVIAPFTEEILFRLTTYNALQFIGSRTAMAATALLFAAAHGQLVTLPALFVIGWFLQNAKNTNGLRRAILLHSLYNTVEILLAVIVATFRK